MPARRILVPLALSLIALMQAPSAFAVHEAPTIEIGRVGGMTWNMLDPLVADSTLSGPDVDGIATWTLDTDFVKTAYTVSDWSIQFKEDPFIFNNLVITNTFGDTAIFTATVLLPIPAFAYNTVINSSLGITVTDSNTDNPLLFDIVPATTIYSGFVNLGPSTTLLSMNPTGPGTLPITTADCPVTFPGCSATSSNGVASLAVAPGVATLIGLTLTFQLSDGDSVGITSRFEIVPEPAILMLLGAGLVAVALARRRSA